jgi:peptidoglycan/xylan/chitin deacetylase (PgdA/CDA1 family)
MIKEHPMKKTYFFYILILSFFLLSNSAAQQKGFNWPDGKKAAVCMSYDDGIMSHLEYAIPDLNAAGFRGTFYLMGTNLRPDMVPAWRDAAAAGHELGCHSLFHPCSGEYDWVPDEYNTEDYTFRRILDELKVMNQFLFAVDGKHQRTYAYPCHVKEVGGISYVDTLSRKGLFVGARNGFSKELLTPQNINLFDIPSMTVTDEVPLEKTLAYIDHTVENGSLAVFCFHGIGGEYIVTSREYHQQIIDYLKD